MPTPPTTTMNSLPPGYRAAVVGASGAIGGALVSALQADPRCSQVHALSRQSEPPLDLLDEASLAAAAARLRAGGPLHLLVCATGVLQVDGPPARKAPGRAGRRHDGARPRRQRHRPGAADQALPRPAAAEGTRPAGGAVGARGQHRRQPTGRLVQLPRQQGRAEHAAAHRRIEVARKRPLAVLAALHPGTVRSGLSAPIIGSAEASSPEDAARHLLAVLDALPAEGASGGFHAWNGLAIPW